MRDCCEQSSQQHSEQNEFGGISGKSPSFSTVLEFHNVKTTCVRERQQRRH